MVSPDNPIDPNPLISRRTVARTAAWAAPAIVLSAASPAFAASTATPLILLDKVSYDFLSGQSATITGTVVPPDGKTLPADFLLTATVTTGFTITTKATLTGLAFTLTIKAPVAATEGTLTVTSPNHPEYLTASASLSSLAPGTVARGFRLLPSANTWKEVTVAGSDTRWFSHTTGIEMMTAAKLGSTKPWLDLRIDLDTSGTKLENYGNTAFGPITKTGGRPANWNSIVMKFQSTVVDITTNGKAGDPNNAVGLVLGSVITTGPTITGASDTFPGGAGFMPNIDPVGKAITLNNKVFAYVPSTLPKGSRGMFEVVITVYLPDGQTAKIGFTSPTFNY